MQAHGRRREREKVPSYSARRQDGARPRGSESEVRGWRVRLTVNDHRPTTSNQSSSSCLPAFTALSISSLTAEHAPCGTMAGENGDSDRRWRHRLQQQQEQQTLRSCTYSQSDHPSVPSAILVIRRTARNFEQLRGSAAVVAATIPARPCRRRSQQPQQQLEQRCTCSPGDR